MFSQEFMHALASAQRDAGASSPLAKVLQALQLEVQRIERNLTIARSEAGAKAVTATGTVKWFNLQNGFGFMVHAATGKDVFVHISAVEKAGLTKLSEGQQIEFQLKENRGKATAVNLKAK